MANIVELREMSDEKLEEMLEIAREEMFNLRFQKAIAQLQNTVRIRHVRREIAQIQETLHKRQLAKEVAAAQTEIAAVLQGKESYYASARYVYEDSGWRVVFEDNNGNELATALVNLNKKHPKTRQERGKKGQPQLVTSFETAA
jgi:large subunit ribosomal protein L29